MGQPEFVPVVERDRVRIDQALPTPDRWAADRVGELKPDGGQPAGAQLGVAGPDQGYALKLAGHLRPLLVMSAGEHVDDAVAGCLGVALKRAALYGRAPVIFDLELAFRLWGFLDVAAPELVELRRPLFAGAAHHYNDRRAIADRVVEAVLRMTPEAVAAEMASAGWRGLHGGA